MHAGHVLHRHPRIRVDSNWCTHNLAEVTDAPTTQNRANAAMGDGKSNRLAQLYNYGQTAGLLNGQGGWASNADTGANKDQGAAFQLLVWRSSLATRVRRTGSRAVVLRVSGLSSSVRNYFAQFRDLSASYSSDLAGFRASSRSGSQDQLVIIPLPPAFFAGAGMLGLVMGACYLRRRQAQLA